MYPDAVSLLRTQLTGGRFLHNNRTTCDDIFQTGIIVFSTIDAVEGDGAQAIGPITIALYLLGSPVCIGYRKPETKRRRTVADQQFPVSASLFVVESIAQKHLKMVVGAAVQTFSDVEGIEKDSFVIIAPRGSKIMFAHLLAIHGKMIKAESTDMYNCTANLFFQVEISLQNYTAPRKGVGDGPSGFYSRVLEYGSRVVAPCGKMGITMCYSPDPLAGAKGLGGCSHNKRMLFTPWPAFAHAVPNLHSPEIRTGRQTCPTRYQLTGSFFPLSTVEHFLSVVTVEYLHTPGSLCVVGQVTLKLPPHQGQGVAHHQTVLHIECGTADVHAMGKTDGKRQYYRCNISSHTIFPKVVRFPTSLPST